MKTIIINLGYLHLAGYTPNTPLNPKWAAKEKDYKLVKDGEVVLLAGEYKLVIDYPLHTPFTHSFKVGAEGMTHRALVTLIAKKYKQIYDEEDKAIGETGHGPYGIWGHCLEDLMLHTATVLENRNINLGVDS